MNDFTTLIISNRRSGTSMTMRMLEFGGIPVVENTNIVKHSYQKYGPYECSTKDADLSIYKGKAIKVLQHLDLFSTPKFKYKVIMPVRDTQQVILSLKSAFPNSTEVYSSLKIKGTLDLFRLIIENRDDMELLEIPYDDYFLKTREVAERIHDFLGKFDIEKAVQAVDKTLYKVRSVPCLISK